LTEVSLTASPDRLAIKLGDALMIANVQSAGFFWLERKMDARQDG